uniref:Signal peptidase complex subunit 2 n=1 Tax=Tetradesmus obliquus TaxID=3088 RepID=A0A383W038_TETOB|eukprot:jgi/Sobl393_1/13462/SZX70006.1
MGPRPVVATAPAEQQPEPEKINLDDGHAIKHKLDSTASEVILQSGYVEDHLISNVKITLGLIAIAVAIYSHFGPGKFPANWSAVVYCVAAYCVLNLVLIIFCNIKEGDSFLITHPKPGSEYGLRVASRMERYSDQYTLIISSANKWLDREVKMETSVTDYFHSDGYLAEAKYKHHVAKLLSQYERLDASSDPRPKALNPGKQD